MPAEIQEIYAAERGQESLTPVVLIHDGGGTIFQYYMLDYLGRSTYGIPCPYFESGTKPGGGIPELAQEYVKVIKNEFGSGSIMIGGWSFGGIISVEIARLLAEDSELNVTGIIMIDSYCPWATGPWQAAPFVPSFLPTTSERMKGLTTKSFHNAREMISSWQRPADFQAPPIVLVKAEEQRELHEDDGKLGWSKYGSLEFLSVGEVPGDHFSMFAANRIDGLSKKIKLGLALFP